MTKEEFEQKFSNGLGDLINDILLKLPTTKNPEDFKLDIFLKSRDLSRIVSEYIEKVSSIETTEEENGESVNQKNRGGSGNDDNDPTKKRGGN